MKCQTLIATTLIFTVLLIAGCGSGRPTTVPVRGKVTFDGKPVPTGRITFYPAEGRSATGAIGPDGSYTLTTFEPGDGALPGKHRVTIRAVQQSSATMSKSPERKLRDGIPDSDLMGTLRWLVPERYSRRETSGLDVEVTPERTEPYDFQL